MDAAGTTLFTGDGRKVVLGKLIKSGGAGSVYRLEESTTQVAKLYHPGADLRMYERRIAAMLELEPQLPALAPDDTRYVQLAWPDAPLRDARGQFLGYLMPVVDIDATDELEYVLQERQARRLGLPTGLGAKVTLAANLCAVIAALHRERHYIVDLKPVNLRFYRRSLYMAMLDCDGFSIQGRGERFEAPQYTPDYLAPEFHLRELGAAGEAQQDRFALAVVVFQLLNFGIHPFTGRPQSHQVPTDIPARIAGRWYAYGLKANPALLPNLTSGHAAMPHELRLLFDRAFDEQVSRGGGTMRPSADEWSDLLRGYAQRAEGKLVTCQRNDAHQHFAGRECAACERGRALVEARAAEARRPPRTRLAARPSPLAVALAMQAGKPAAPTTAPSGTSSIPPHVLARINQAWASRAPAAPPPATNLPSTSMPPPAATSRRPANWSTPAPSPARTLFLPMVSIVAIVAVAMMIAVLVSKGIGDRQQGAAVAADPAAMPAQAEQPAPLRTPTPPPADLDAQAQEIEALAVALVQNDDAEVLQQLAVLHDRARDRREGWKIQWEQARAAGEDAGRALSSDAVVEAGVASRQAGWLALDLGDDANALSLFAAAIWADAGDADAWLGYGLVAPTRRDAIGAMAVALLMYPDMTTARVNRDLYFPMASRGDARKQVELERLVNTAMPIAERQRQRLPPDLVRQSEPIAWDTP